MLSLLAALAVVATCHADSRYDAAASLLAQSRAAQDLTRRNALLDAGLARLGDHYSTNPVTHRSVIVMDDTGQHLALAHWQARRGELPAAIREKDGILKDRLALFHDALCGRY